jgi:licheninase
VLLCIKDAVGEIVERVADESQPARSGLENVVGSGYQELLRDSPTAPKDQESPDFRSRSVPWVLVVGLDHMLLAEPVREQDGMTFFDDFTSFDTARWSKGDHTLGHSYLDPTNVDVDGENLRLKLSAHSFEGGEVLTEALHGYGSYSARIRVPNTPGSITGLFLYKSPDYESEIDIEIFNDSSQRVMFATYAGGRQSHTETMTLPFDPTTGFHEYGFDYSQESVTFYVDGQPTRTWSDGIPQTSMHLMLNTWFPSWLEVRKLKKTAHTYVNWIGYATRP